MRFSHYTMQQTPPTTYQGNDRVLFGFIFGLLSFWLFAMTLLNIHVDMNKELGLSISTLSFAVSVTSLVSGLFIVVFGGLADRLGRVKLIRWGFYTAILGALLIALTPAQSALTAPVLIVGRALQGVSGACIMPSSLALLGVYWSGKGRQRAVSLWSMGTWGGSSFAALFGGFMISTLGWRAIFYVCALFAIIGLLLIKGLPESRAEQQQAKRFDIFGFVAFFIGILSLQLFIANAPVWGWLSVASLTTISVSIIAIVVFIKVELGRTGAFMNFALFRNKTFTGATISNLILNATAGVLVVSLSVLQQGGRIDPATAGYLTIGYGVSILLFIRVGEKLLQRFGPRKPMIWGCMLIIVSVLLMSQTQLMTGVYMILTGVAYVLFGTGLAFYATPSTDAALSSLPRDLSGQGSGIYKMASSLGAAFGLAISQAIYNGIQVSGEPIELLGNLINFVGQQGNLNFRHAAMVTMTFNIVLLLLAILSIALTIPKQKKQTEA